MGAPKLGRRIEEHLLRLLTEDRPDPDRFLADLRHLRAREDAPASSLALRLLAHVNVSEEDAERTWGDILAHRRILTRALGRDPGLRVAALDHLQNVEHRLRSPKIVEMREFAETERSALTDHLTGLSNRRAFRRGLEREILRGQRYGLVLSVLMLDLDHFKAVNDACGHLFGDLVLGRVGRLLRRSIREADIAARYGGEEFAVMLPETERTGAYVAGERIRRHVSRAFASEPTAGRDVPLTLSGGIASYPEDGIEADALLDRADRALYLAKRAGRNRISLYWAERRSEVRYPVHRGARVWPAMRREGEGRPALALNLSRAGALLETHEPLRPADPVRVVLEGPSAGCDVTGRVVHVERSPGADLYHAGIAFDVRLPEDRLLEQIPFGRRAEVATQGTPS